MQDPQTVLFYSSRREVSLQHISLDSVRCFLSSDYPWPDAPILRHEADQLTDIGGFSRRYEDSEDDDEEGGDDDDEEEEEEEEEAAGGDDKAKVGKWLIAVSTKTEISTGNSVSEAMLTRITAPPAAKKQRTDADTSASGGKADGDSKPLVVKKADQKEEEEEEQDEDADSEDDNEAGEEGEGDIAGDDGEDGEDDEDDEEEEDDGDDDDDEQQDAKDGKKK